MYTQPNINKSPVCEYVNLNVMNHYKVQMKGALPLAVC